MTAATSVRAPVLFQYPGGKSWFVPHARRWLRTLGAPVPMLHEPFAGGAAVGLMALLEGLADELVLVERHEGVAAVWRCIAGGYGPILAAAVERIDGHGPPVVLNAPFLVREALKALVDNRTGFGGIMDRKMCRRPREPWRVWNPRTLAERIRRLHEVRDRLHAAWDDGMVYLERRKPGVYFVDPPYPVAGRALYRHWDVDPRQLFALLAKLDQPFVLTYEDLAPIRKLAREHGMECRSVPMKDNLNRHSHELVIGHGLDWL